MLKLDGSASELHFNPKEDKIAVALAKNPLIDEHIMFRKVHIVDLKTGQATNLNNPGKLGQLAWSPDGKIIAAISGFDKHDPKEGRLRLYSFENPGWHHFTGTPGHVESIAWKGRAIVFQSSDGVLAALSSFDLNDLKRDTKTSVHQIVLSNVAVSHHGMAMALVGHTANHAPEVYFCDKGDEPRRLTDSNPWLKNMKFAKLQEVVKYKARDGLELEGLLIRPLNEEKGKRYPLILNVHGGPEAHYSNGWITNYNALGQVAAARGMAVFYPNYRGSTGYGVEFSMKGQKEAGGKEFDDLIDGVDHLVKLGLVDDKKVGITGGSYGGYATAWGSTLLLPPLRRRRHVRRRLRCWISCSGTTDIPQEMFLVHHSQEGKQWDDWDYFKKASPLAHLDKEGQDAAPYHAVGKADPARQPRPIARRCTAI